MQKLWRFGPPLLAGCLFLTTGGCHSPSKAGAGFASVEIHGNTPGQIHDAAVAVFKENGYTLAQPGRTQFSLEKQGSKMSDVAYGNWMGEEPVWIRVKLEIEPAGAEAAFRLGCQAFIVRDRGSVVEDELRMNRLRARPYQKLLDQVAKRLHGG